MKLSVCIITKNEERHIERCLKSIYPLAEKGLAEIILVDTGSKDKTVEIAKKYTDNIFSYVWRDDFAEARNFSITKAKGEYLLIIDADEEVEKDSLNKIVNLFNDEEYRKFNAFTFKEKNFTDEDLKNFGIFTRAFIFKNSEDFFYTGSIHEQPSIMMPCKHLDAYILHYGYIMNEKVKEEKFIRNSKLLKKELIKNPDNLYYRYQLAVTYQVHGDTKEAAKEIDIVINILKNKVYDKLHLLYYSAAAQIYKSEGLYDKVIEVCSRGLEKQKDFIDLVYSMMQAFYMTEKYEKALDYAEGYFMLLRDFKKHDIFHDTRFLFYSLSCKEEVENIELVCAYKTKKIELKEFIEKCKFKNVDKTSGEHIIKDLIYFIESCKINNDTHIKNLKYLKNVIDFVFERTLNSKQLKNLTQEENLYIVDKYLKLGKLLIEKNKVLTREEKEFFKAINKASQCVEKANVIDAVKFIKYGIEKNPNMARPMQVYIEKIMNRQETIRYNHEINELFNELKNKIGELIQSGYIKEAEELIKECEKYNMDEELYSMKAVMLIMNNNITDAEELLNKAVKKYSKSFDLLYNLAYVYEIGENQVLALEYYKKSLELCEHKDMKMELINKIENMEKDCKFKR
ncbi:TPR domain-containing glycosyltransferase [Clostridium sp. ZS2-4]|uniref:TPR domain-containing glycosyltransferase n=1 Tax=Clostridium sp. ZS2-4 TaxID=2987703 RepID=UPI00227B6FF2|nr:TPR domain-containing glycosyltransferase [Clostridium sp. ZS2-4]MCY6353969.1 glycosyltransferase [Clostridium sp. ZS2-4]